MEIPEQVLELDLPTLLLDSRSSRVTGTTVPGIQSAGYLAVEGKVRVGLRLNSHDADPSHLKMDVRLLEARYVVPDGCSENARKTILRLNSALNDRLLGEALPDF